MNIQLRFWPEHEQHSLARWLTTWIQSMCGSQGLNDKFEELVTNNPNQVKSPAMSSCCVVS